MIKFLEKLLSLIYISSCFYCGSAKDDKILCDKCKRKINFMPPSNIKEMYGCKIYACTLYEDVIKKLIKDLKYHKKKKLAKLHAEIMYEYFTRLKLNEDFLILSVPIHKNRLKERKYNHMELVADELSKISGFKNNKKFLLRIKDTKKQFKLHRNERIKNIKNAFELNPNQNIDKNRQLLIIDDITSTGITLEEIIKLLKNNGYNNLTAIALATPDVWN